MMKITKCEKCGIERNADTVDFCPRCAYGLTVMPIAAESQRNSRDNARAKERRQNILDMVKSEERWYRESLDLHNFESLIKSLPPQVHTQSRKRGLIMFKKKLVVTLKDSYQMSFPRIATLLGYKDHTTALYHYNWCKERKVAGYRPWDVRQGVRMST